MGSIRTKYGSEEAGLGENFLAVIWLMGDLLDQIREFGKILHDLKTEGMEFSDIFLVVSTIKNLLPSLADFGRKLKQKPENFSFDNLLIISKLK